MKQQHHTVSPAFMMFLKTTVRETPAIINNMLVNFLKTDIVFG